MTIPHPRTSSRLAALALLSALVATACSSPTTDLKPIQADLQTQARAQAALVDRIAELEDLVETMTATQGGSLVDLTDALESRATELETQLAELKALLEAEQTAREDGDVTNAAALSNLKASFSDLKASLDAVQASLAKVDRDLKSLRTAHELLRAEFESHLRNHS